MLWVRSSGPPAVTVRMHGSPRPGAHTIEGSWVTGQGWSPAKRGHVIPLLGPQGMTGTLVQVGSEGWDGEVGEEKENIRGIGGLGPFWELGMGVLAGARWAGCLLYAGSCCIYAQDGRSRGSPPQRPRTAEMGRDLPKTACGQTGTKPMFFPPGPQDPLPALRFSLC